MGISKNIAVYKHISSEVSIKVKLAATIFGIGAGFAVYKLLWDSIPICAAAGIGLFSVIIYLFGSHQKVRLELSDTGFITAFCDGEKIHSFWVIGADLEYSESPKPLLTIHGRGFKQTISSSLIGAKNVRRLRQDLKNSFK